MLYGLGLLGEAGPAGEFHGGVAAQGRRLAGVQDRAPHQLPPRRCRFCSSTRCGLSGCPAYGRQLVADEPAVQAQFAELVAMQHAALSPSRPFHLRTLLNPGKHGPILSGVGDVGEAVGPRWVDNAPSC